MENTYDYIIVGAGHNGLTAATILARNNARVLVVESRPLPGGQSSGSSYKGSWYPRVAYALGLMPGELASILGLNLSEVAHWTDPSWVYIVDGGEWLVWWRSPEKLDDEFRAHGVLSGWREFRAAIKAFRECAAAEGILYTIEPPSLEEAADRLEKCRPGLGEAVREPWIEWAGSLLGREVAEALTYPVFLYEPGYASLYFNMNLGVWGIARRGFTLLAHRLEALARRAGADILYGAKAFIDVDLKSGRAAGVTLGSSGKRLKARRGVILAASILCLPRLIPAEAYDALVEKRDRRAIERLASLDLSIDRVNMAFEEKPRAPTRFEAPPILVMDSEGVSGEAVYPSLHEPVEGPHVVSFSGATSLKPGELGVLLAGSEPVWWERVDRRVLDADYCNPTGCPNHIPMTAEHILDRRPLPGWADYRTPIEGLYHASASSHPGGQVTGIPGHNAAVRALLDIGIKPRGHLVSNRHLRLQGGGVG